ncbi:MAG: tetratricopeptide repeat protein [Mariniblastus sp.]
MKTKYQSLLSPASIVLLLVSFVVVSSVHGFDDTDSSVGADASTGKRFALLIGVRAYYPDRFSPLPGAETDMTDLSKVLSNKGFKRENITLMTNTAGAEDPRLLPLSNNIRKQLKKLAKTCTKDDAVIIALAGHGIQQKGKKYWFCPFDADLEDQATLICIDEIYASIKNCKAQFKLVLIDACREDTLSDPSAAKDSVAGSMADLPQPPAGTATFVSCSQSQLAYERQTEGRANGVFFHAIIDGLGGSAAGEDGTVTLPDLERFVKKNVESYVRKTYNAEQFPVLRNNTTGLFPIIEYSLSSSQLEKLQWLIQRDKYDKAMEIVEGLLATNAKDGLALAARSKITTYQAESDSDMSQLNRALRDAQKAVKYAPNEAEPHVALANVYRLKKDFEKALTETSIALEIDPNNVLAHIIRGTTFHGMKDVDRLISEAETATEIDPEHPEARGLLAAAFFARDRMDEGQMELDRAIALHPDIPMLFFLKGYGYEQMGEHAKAVLQYSSAIRVDPDNPKLYVRRALSLGNSGDYPAAWEDVAKAEAINPTYFDVTTAKAMLHINQQQWDEALVALDAGLKINPDSPDLLLGRGMAYLYKQRLKESKKDLLRLLEIDAERAEAHMSLGLIALYQGEVDKALAYSSRATRYNDRLSQAHYVKSACYMKKSEFKKAIAPLSRAIELEPKNPTYYQLRGMLYTKVGQTRNARKDNSTFLALQQGG